MQKRGVWLGGGGGQDGCEPRFVLIVKMHKKSREGWGRRSGWGQVGCEPLIEVIVKMKKRKSGGGVRVEVKEELKLL